MKESPPCNTEDTVSLSWWPGGCCLVTQVTVSVTHLQCVLVILPGGDSSYNKITVGDTEQNQFKGQNQVYELIKMLVTQSPALVMLCGYTHDDIIAHCNFQKIVTVLSAITISS